MYSKAANPTSPREKLSQAGDKIMDDLHELREDARHLKSDIKNAAYTASDAARQAGSQVREAAHTVISAPGSFVSKVRDRPIQSALIALALGVLVGKLYRR